MKLREIPRLIAAIPAWLDENKLRRKLRQHEKVKLPRMSLIDFYNIRRRK